MQIELEDLKDEFAPHKPHVGVELGEGDTDLIVGVCGLDNVEAAWMLEAALVGLIDSFNDKEREEYEEDE